MTASEILTGALGIIVLVSFFSFVIYASYQSSEGRSDACKTLGYEKAILDNGYGLCEDANSDLHYVKFSCKGVFNNDCTAKDIKVGDVTGVLK